MAQLIIGAFLGGVFLGTYQSWVKFLSRTGAILLTFLAGAELDPFVFKMKWKEASIVGLLVFYRPSSDARLSPTGFCIGLVQRVGLPL